MSDHEAEEVLRELDGTSLPMPPSAPALLAAPTLPVLRAAMNHLLASTADWSTLSLRSVREQLASSLGLPKNGLDEWKAVLDSMTKQAMEETRPQARASQEDSAEPSASEAMKGIVALVGAEKGGAQLSVYLGTASRILPDTVNATDLVDISQFTEQAMCEKILDALNNPVSPQGRAGRPRDVAEDGSTINKVDTIIVKQEIHKDGTAAQQKGFNGNVGCSFHCWLM